MASRYVTKTASASLVRALDLPSLRSVLADCPTGYRLHSVVPELDRYGTTLFYVIFEDAVNGF